MSAVPAQLDGPAEAPYAHGGPIGRARLKFVAEDFIVEESLGFELDGEGEHLFVKIEKHGLNTEEAALKLARLAGVRRRDLGFAGLKDKNAVARQWFSIWLARGGDPRWETLKDSKMKILSTRRHARKLKRGALVSNRFQIRLRELDIQPARLEALLTRISEAGVPNYFGPQRFGYRGRNLSEAHRFFDSGARAKGRETRSMLLSAARSFLFNRILARRVEENIWNRAIDGDALMFDGSKAYFRTTLPSDQDILRVEAGKLHPSGVLWGVGGSDAGLDALRLETEVVEHYPRFVRGLENSGVESGRRSLRLIAKNLRWRFEGNRDLVLDFMLPAGGYATSVLRELVDWGA